MGVGRREKGGNGNRARDPKMGQLTLSIGPARTGVRSYVQRATIPSKRVIHIYIEHSNI
jgi:hypothetical protein